MPIKLRVAGSTYLDSVTVTAGFFNALVVTGGGVPPYTYSVDTGALPTGLSVTIVPDFMTGNANVVGLFTGSIKVVDSIAQSAVFFFKWYVVPNAGEHLSILNGIPFFPDGLSGAPYNVQIFGAGGVPPYNFSGTPFIDPNGDPFIAGVYPPGMHDGVPYGLTMQPTGLVNGIPTSNNGDWYAAFILTDANNGVGFFGQNHWRLHTGPSKPVNYLPIKDNPVPLGDWQRCCRKGRS